MRIATGDFTFLTKFENGAELKVHLGSISKPEVKAIGDVLELIKLQDFEISLKLQDKTWDLFKLETAVYKASFEQVDPRISSPKTKYEKAKLRSAEKNHRSKSMNFSESKDVLYRSKSNIVELSNLLISVPYEIDSFLESFRELANSFLSTESENKRSSHSPQTPTEYERRIGVVTSLYNMFSHKYILSLKNFKFLMEDNPLEVLKGNKDQYSSPKEVH